MLFLNGFNAGTPVSFPVPQQENCQFKPFFQLPVIRAVREACNFVTPKVGKVPRKVKPQVSFSNKSPVLFTPIRLLEPPPNWLDKPPPLEFWESTTNTSRTQTKIMILMRATYIKGGEFNCYRFQKRVAEGKAFRACCSAVKANILVYLL